MPLSPPCRRCWLLRFSYFRRATVTAAIFDYADDDFDALFTPPPIRLFAADYIVASFHFPAFAGLPLLKGCFSLKVNAAFHYYAKMMFISRLITPLRYLFSMMPPLLRRYCRLRQMPLSCCYAAHTAPLFAYAYAGYAIAAMSLHSAPASPPFSSPLMIIFLRCFRFSSAIDYRIIRKAT